MLLGGTLATCRPGWPTPLWRPAPTPIISSGRSTFLGARTVERAASPHHKEGAARMIPMNPVVGIDCGKPLRANDDETQAARKFRLEGVGELSRGHAQ